MCQWRFLFGFEMLYSDVSGYSSFIPPCMHPSEHCATSLPAILSVKHTLKRKQGQATSIIRPLLGNMYAVPICEHHANIYFV